MFPNVRSYTVGVPAASSTSHTVPLPSSVVAGDYLFVVFSSDGSPTVTWDQSTAGSWTLLSSANINVSCTQVIYYKIATGTEGSLSLTIQTSNSEWTSYYTASVQNVGEVLAATPVTNTNTIIPNSPLLSTNWASYGSLVFSIATFDNGVESTVSQYPVGYTDNQNVTTSGTGIANTAIASRTIIANSENPGEFLLDNARPTIANTIAFRSINQVTMPAVDTASNYWLSTVYQGSKLGPTYLISDTDTTETTLLYSILGLESPAVAPVITTVDVDDQIIVEQIGATVTGTNLITADGARVRYNSVILNMQSYSASASPTFNVPNLTEFFSSGMPLGTATFELLRIL